MAAFYLDHNVARQLADLLRLAGHDARTAPELGIERAGDEEFVSLAARSARILLTHNARDFTLLHAAWRRWSREWGVTVHHSGIMVLIPPLLPPQAAQEVIALLGSGQSLQDELFTWRRHRGWTRQP